MKIILASASPRRKELMTTAGLEFETVVADVDESVPQGTLPANAAAMTAEKKALAVAQAYPQALVVGADTTVIIDGDILGKPKDKDDAVKMLERLSGREHTVVTGVCIVSSNKKITFADETKVTFYELSHDEIVKYVDSGEPMDKAGAYGIQGLGCVLVKGIQGDYFSVMGLPIARVVREIRVLSHC